MDDKEECEGVYTDGQFIYNRIPDNIDGTWGYSDHLQQRHIQYAYLWSLGSRISDICPEHLKTRWAAREGTIRAHYKSLRTTRINMGDVCFYELIPDKQLEHYFQTKNEICDWVFANVDKPTHYGLLHDSYITTQNIAKHEVTINKHKLFRYSQNDAKARSLWNWLKDRGPVYTKYNLFGSVTGRLTTAEGSFPIMNLKTELKDIVEPKWDCFLELDFNAAEIRTMISLMGQEQPPEDIHEWNIKNIFREEISREKAKQKFFAWLYNSENKTIDSEFYSKDVLVEKFYIDGKIHTPFGRRTVCDRFHALNYLLQSASSDNCLDRVNKIERFLRDRRSYVAFTIHDCCIIDLHRDDRSLIPQLKQIFEDTKLGQFKSSCHIGKNFGEMKEFKWRA
tara:strand:- start:2253 stop:3434 length:1182 start_codon:yes stop_codon:yes gene_type:complete